MAALHLKLTYIGFFDLTILGVEELTLSQMAW